MLKKELIELYKQTDRKYNRELFMKLYEVKVNFTDLEFAAKNYKQILDFARYVIFNKGTNRVRIGENIFDFLQWLIIYICESCDFDIEILDESLIDNSTDEELKKIHTINLNLFYFAKELFNYSIPRGLNDSRWKGYALGIIAKLLNYYKISNKFELFIIGLQRTKEKVILEALNELHYHFEYFQEEQLSEEIVRELDKLILKTKNRTIATGVLNLQVITKFISEIEALSRIDDWKEKFYYRYYWGYKTKYLLTADSLDAVLIPKDKKSIITMSDLMNSADFEKGTSLSNRNELLVTLRYKSVMKSQISAEFDLLPVFRHGDYPLVPTGEIVFQPKINVDYDQIRTYCNSQISLVKQSKYGTFTVKPTDINDLLKLSNQIYESGLVEWCEPSFIILNIICTPTNLAFDMFFV